MLGIEHAKNTKSLCCKRPSSRVPMVKLHSDQMIKKWWVILFILSNEGSYVDISISSDSNGEIVGFGQNINPMWEIALSSHIFLECSTGCSSAIYFSIIHWHGHKISWEKRDIWLHDFRRVSSSEGPHYIAGSISHILPDRVVASVFIVLHCGLKSRYNWGKFLYFEKTASR